MDAPTRNGAAARAGSPPELSFSVESVAPDRYAMAPTLLFRLAVARVGGGPVRSLALNVQIRIAATRRSYGAVEREKLVELFGPTEQWGRSLSSMLWTTATIQAPGFTDATVIELPVGCTYDFEVATAKYFHALDGGEIPLELLFSGTIFYAAPDGALRISHVPWSQEADHRLPVSVWSEMMDRHFPDSAWLRLRTTSFDRLYSYRTRGGFVGWEDTLDSLLRNAEER